MKYRWEEDDVVPGRIVCKPSQKNPFVPCGWSAKWTRKIGWLATAPSDQHFCTIAMTDGMVGKGKTAAEMVQWLNQEGMIPMPHPWLLATMEYLRDCYVKGG